MVIALAFVVALVATPDAARPDIATQAPPAAAIRPAIASDADRQVVLTLTRATLVALAHANETNDYSVLYALTAPSFRASNTEVGLASAFAPLRAARIDLLQATVIEPTFNPAPFIESGNRLVVRGAVAIQPAPMRFELTFEPVDGVWRLSGLALEPSR